ncbi:MAG: chemotaxis protein [Campylobacter sp.]|nr:chemotaxis protein [Campylobacter sp.]
MTQEELDALLASDMGDMESMAVEDPLLQAEEETEEAEEEARSDDREGIVESKTTDVDNFRVESDVTWPPPPPTDDHKMVNQLDDVTKDSEKKGIELLNKLETINGFFMDGEGTCTEIKNGLDKNIEIFTLLTEKFPSIASFSEALEANKNLNTRVDALVGSLQMGEDEIMMAMDMMQYQDIHRQKIERVINVMRALSRYMNTLFESKKDDTKRVSSAVHIAGDTTTENLVNSEEIEALIENLGKEKS